MTLLWDRKCKLTVQINNGQPEALDLSDFKIVFHIGQATTSTPKAAEFYIYNLSESTMNRLAGMNNERIETTLIFESGYMLGPLEIVFKGRVFQYRRGRDNPTDTWLCILAQSGDRLKNAALVNQCVPAGTTIDDTGKILIAEANKQGIENGDLVDLRQQQYPRGRVFFGSLEQNLRQFYEENNMLIDFSDDTLSIAPVIGYTPVPVQVLTPTTGMVGMPQLTSEGLKVSCLLNPKMKWGGRVQVDMTNLQTEGYDISYGGQEVDQAQKDPRMATNAGGLFLIRSVEHHGDTRGTEWYTDLVCIGIDAIVPKTGITIEAVDDNYRPSDTAGG
ncbi:baseplate hub protein [Acinetobacter sp. CE-15]|uniref:baseplate hub protein n=1 Tax=Acinetobacter sp. CE-15 TaxID=3425693 RepID=UPI003DA33D10